MAVVINEINQSQLKLWRRCQRAWDYKNRQHLEPKVRDRPMHIGSWIHACLEWHYRVGDWRIGHDLFVQEYNKLFEEERRALDTKNAKAGEPLPSQIERIMEGYFFRYKDDGWKVVAVEMEWRVTVNTSVGPITLRGKVDLVIEDAEGNLWVVDTKSTEKIPIITAFHSMDPQLILYPWGIQRDPAWAELLAGRKIAGIIFNYARSKPPTVPEMTQGRRSKKDPDVWLEEPRISKQAVVTDYLTAHKFLVDNGKDPADYTEYLDGLLSSDEMLVRYKLPISEVATKRVVYESLRTARSILDHSDVVRNVTRDCDRCAYRTICRAELFGMDTTFIREHEFTVSDGETETQEGDDLGDDPED